MAVILDISLFAFIIIFAFRSKKVRSLTHELTDLCSVMFASFASVKFSNFLALSTYSLFFREELINKLLPLTQKIYHMDGVSTNLERVLRQLPGFITNGSRWMVLHDETIPVWVDRYACHPAEQAAGEISDLIAGPVVEAVFYAVYLLLSFIMFNYIFKTIFSLLKADLKGIIEFEEPILCACVGAVKGFIFSLVVLSVIKLTLPCFEVYQTFDSWVGDTIFFRIMFNDNILIYL